MRIPYVINRSALKEYYPSPQSLSLLSEDVRIIISEDFEEWDKDICPNLRDLCVAVIANTFEEKPILNELPCADRDYLLEILSPNIPLEICIPVIDTEFYWQRRFEDKFGVLLRTRPKESTWKSLYIERHVQYLIENAQPQYNDEETMQEILALCDPYVKYVKATQLLPWEPPLTMEKEDIPEEYPDNHINFIPIFKMLNNMEEFDLIIGQNNVSETFTWRMLHVSAQDCRNLGKACNYVQTLKILRLHRSFVDDKQTQALMEGLVLNTTIEELDLSNCRIKDHGALCIAKILQVHPKLRILNLCNNLIELRGAEGLGFSLIQENCSPLKRLVLRMNPLKHLGCLAIMRAMMRANRPEELNLAACGFEDETGARTAQMIRYNKCLLKLDISSNWIDEDNGQFIVEALMINRYLHWMDVRETDMSKEQQRTIKKLLLRNRTGEEEFTDDEIEILEEESEEEEENDGEEGEMDTSKHEDETENK